MAIQAIYLIIKSLKLNLAQRLVCSVNYFISELTWVPERVNNFPNIMWDHLGWDNRLLFGSLNYGKLKILDQKERYSSCSPGSFKAQRPSRTWNHEHRTGNNLEEQIFKLPFIVSLWRFKYPLPFTYIPVHYGYLLASLLAWLSSICPSRPTIAFCLSPFCSGSQETEEHIFPYPLMLGCVQPIKGTGRQAESEFTSSWLPTSFYWQPHVCQATPRCSHPL